MVMFEAAACENTKLANKALAMLDELGANSKNVAHYKHDQHHGCECIIRMRYLAVCKAH